MSIEIAILGGFSNAIRGGQWREWFNVPEEKFKWDVSDLANAAIYALAVFFTTGDYIVAASSFFLMWLGAAPGWGDYIGAIGGWRHSDLKENRIIDPLISHLKFSPKLWGAAGLFFRGLFWGVCLSLPFFYIGDVMRAVEFIACGAMMPLAYWLSIGWAKHRAGDKWSSAGWALGEIFFGLVLWSALY